MRKALVVDDSRLARVSLSRMLERRGFEVDGVESGEEALAAGTEGAPGAVLMDVALAGAMNGIQAAVALTHFQRGRPRGAVRLFHTAQQKWAGVPPGYGGLDRESFLRRLGHLMAPLLQADEAERASVRMDPARMFRIELTGEPFGR